MKKLYAGVGSRKTPRDVLDTMTKMAKYLQYHGWVLRSGGAQGADKAFEAGAGSLKEIFLAKHVVGETGSEALYIAKTIHPNWNACSDYAKKLHARNVFQVLGADLETPVEFLVCWTPNGEKVGGTRTAIILAENNNIPVINMGKEGWKEDFVREFFGEATE